MEHNQKIKKILGVLIVAGLALTGYLRALPQINFDEFYINCDPGEFEYICKNYAEDNYIYASIRHDGKTWDSVRMRIRGDDSRAFPKKSLKFKFEGEAFSNGRTTLNLNADWLDKTFIHQWLASRIFNDLGYPCFRASYAKVYLNDNFHGIFINVENVDEEFIAARGMNPDNNLYKASNDGASLSRYDFEKDYWEKKIGQEANFDDLKELIRILNDTPDARYKDSLLKYFDYDKLLDILAINFLIQNRSTYYHNYFMYHDLGSGKWTMLPWDLDKSCAHYSYWMFYGEWGYAHSHANPIIERALAVDVVFADLRKKLTDISNKYYNGQSLLPVVDSLEKALEPVIFADTSHQLGSVEEWKARLELDRDHIRNCYKAVIQLFDTNPRVFHIETKDSPELGSKIRFTWRKSQSPKNYPLYYKLSISKEFDHDKPGAYQISGIRDTSYVIDTLLPEGTYYYTVMAYDSLSYQWGYDHFNTMEVARGTKIPCEINDRLILGKEGSPYVIDCDVTIGEKGELIAGPGAEIIFMDTVKMQSSGKINFEGTEEELVRLTGASSFNKAIMLELQPGSRTLFNHCSIKNTSVKAIQGEISLKNCSYDISSTSLLRTWFIMSYDSKMDVDSSSFIGNNNCEGLVVERTETNISNSKFRDISDPIELSNQSGSKIINNEIKHSLDDGIDINFCRDILIEGNSLSDIADKGISVGNEFPSVNIQIRHNIIAGCYDGVGIKDSSSGLLENNTFYKNNTAVHCFEKTPGSGGAYATVRNCIFAESEEWNYSADSLSDIKITYSLADNELIPGAGNITGDPQFLDTSRYNFHLRETSPCIDAGDPDTGLDPDGSRADIGAFYFNQALPALVINEISYNASAESDGGDWIEFYNNSGRDVDLSGWKFMDESDSHVFSFPGYLLKAGAYLVLAGDETKFRAVYPGVENFITGLSFGFSGSGELLRLYYKDGRLADSVRYDDAEPWPTEADGQGPSIELIDPDSDNGKGENWRASAGTGTPGRINDNYMEARELAPGDPNNTIIISPNPASDFIEINLVNWHACSLQENLRIYNSLGECVITPLAFGEGMGLRLDISPLPPGVYIVRFGDRVSKFIKL